MRLRELAGSRLRSGYRRRRAPLKRGGWAVNERIYRLDTEEGLTVRRSIGRRQPATNAFHKGLRRFRISDGARTRK